MNPKDRDDADRARERSLRAADPRRHQKKYQPRLSLYDENESLAERGTRLEDFILPEGES